MCRVEVLLSAVSAEVQVLVGSFPSAVPAKVQVLPELPEVFRVLLFAAAAKADYTAAVTEQAQRSRVTERQRVFLLMPQEVSVLSGRSAPRCLPAEQMP